MTSKLVRVSEEVHARLSAYADGRPLGLAVEMLLDHRDHHVQEHGERKRPKFEANPGDPIRAVEWPKVEHHKPADHGFIPQALNALRCMSCGRPKHQHR